MKLSDFSVSGGNRKTLVVLGAGASRGASFVDDQSKPLPPLDLDFFQQLSRIQQSEEGHRLLSFVRQEYQHEIGLSMEQFFSEADYTNRFHHELHLDRGPYVKRYDRALSDFYNVLPTLLERTTADNCSYHASIAKHLRPFDCIISFNYDCIMDRALRDQAGRNWNPDNGSYGFDVSAGSRYWKQHIGQSPVNNPIKLLKLHGSQNWKRSSTSSIKLCRSTKEVSTLEGVIIPPTWFKNLTIFPFADIWKAARKEVRSARILVVIGYSVPKTDLFARSLFKVEAGSKEKREKLDLLVIVNPDEIARRAFIELIRGGIHASTRILEYKLLMDFDKLLTRPS